MVFDWFKRGQAPQNPPPAAPELTPEPPAAEQVAEAAAPAAAEAPRPLSTPVDAPASPPEPAAAPAPAAAAASGVDEDALAWARQAYARLKAQQEAERQAAEAAEPPAPVPAPEPEPAPAASAEPGAGSVSPLQNPAPAEAPLAPPPATAAPGLSLLELAAQQRAQRQQELRERAIETAPESAPAATPAAPEAVSAQPATATTAAAPADEAAPQLGAFDDDFTWSAEVLAAQGRRLDDISLEEIDWLGRLRRGMEKTRRNFVTQLLDTLGDDPLTPEVLDELETLLLRADVGVQATDQVLEALRQRMNQEVVDPAEGIRFLKEQLRGLLDAPIAASGAPLLAPERGRLNVWLMVGVNGVGKTTTLGKLANLAIRSGYSCLIAAADTFRAAAVRQVEVWGERSGVTVVSNPSANADPAAVVFDAIGAAKAKGTDLVLVDTAGRLQTKHNLMEELAKVRRIVDKLAPEAVVQSLLVLDASQGQNGLKQAMAFAEAAGLTGVVLTKLDGSSRGGVALAVSSEAGLPIRFIGAGEGIRDLRPFNSFEFVEALLAP
ncbi:MAG: signal recognition particle-docking protein FtsY [Cyanobacteriota bacterium]